MNYSGTLSSKEAVPYDYEMEQKRDHPEIMIEGRFLGPVDLEKAATFLHTLGDVILDLERDMLEIAFIGNTPSGIGILFGNGQFTLTGISGIEAAELFVRTVLRGILCTSCGTCLAYCKNDAIILEGDHIRVSTEKCVQCKVCLSGKCPSLYVVN
jgi:ferredoxin